MTRVRITVTVNRLRRYCRDWTLLRHLVAELLDGAQHAGGPGATRYLQAIYDEVCRREQDARDRSEP